MKVPYNRLVNFGLVVVVLGLGILIVPQWFHTSSAPANAEPALSGATQTNAAAQPPPEALSANAPAPIPPVTAPETPAPPEAPPLATAPPSAPSTQASAQTARPPGNASPSTPPPETVSSDEIQLSFQGANIEMVVQWLAKTTGKSVVKHPRVQCQLTIVSSKKLPPRDAINLIYRALALEGFTTIESSKSVLIVPDGQEIKLSPEFVDTSQTEIPEGRQRLVKIFPLTHLEAGEVREKIRAVLTEKATIDVADRSNQLIVTDYTENIRLLSELIKELDVPAGGDTVIEFYSLKHAEAEELGNLLTLILNSQPAPPSSPGRAAPSSARSSPSSSSGVPAPPGGSSTPPPPSTGAPPPSAAAPGAAQAMRIWPDKTANRLIVAAPKSKQPEIQRLIDTLDTEKPRDVSIRLIFLKNVAAEDLVREMGPLFQKMSGQSLKEAIEVAANSRANSLIVLSSESNFKIIEGLVSALDTEEAQEKAMRAFPLKHADAEDVAKQMQDLNQDQESSSRYPFFFISSSSMGARGLRKPTFVADRRRNTVIVQAPPAAMENIAKMIEQLDEPVTDDSLAPRIFRLRYVSAIDIEEVLNELFVKRPQQRSYWDDYYYYSPSRQGADPQSGRLYGKIRITSEPYANALIVTANSPEHLSAVEDVVKQLDVPSQAGETTLRVELKFAKASTVANSINILFAKGGSPPLRPQAQPGQTGQQSPQQQQLASSQRNFELEQETKEEGYYPWLGGQPENYRALDGRAAAHQVSDLVGRVRVVPDPRSNSLLISANVHLLPQVVTLVEDLDVPTAQVLIEAKIIEVSTDALDKLGVRWSPEGDRTFTAEDLDNAILANVRGRHLQEFGGRTSLLADSLNGLRSGLIESTINVDLLIQFLRKTTDAKVLAEPQINIADNELGKLFVGQQVPFIDRSLSTDVGGLNQSFSYKDVGVILEVTPHINTAGDVALKIRTESSAIVPGQTLLGGAILDTRNFKTDLTVKHGQTLVLGGIIQRQISDTLRKTPILGSIPGLGWLFKKKDAIRREVELMVFLRPTVVRTSEEAKALLEEVEQRTPLIKQWKEENQPDTGSPPPKTAPAIRDELGKTGK